MDDLTRASRADLIALVRQQQALIAELQAANARVQARVQQLEARVRELEARVEKGGPCGMPGHKPTQPEPQGPPKPRQR